MALYQIFLYWSSSNIWMSLEGTITLQKSSFSHTFFEIHVYLLLRKNEGISDNKNYCNV